MFLLFLLTLSAFFAIGNSGILARFGSEKYICNDDESDTCSEGFVSDVMVVCCRNVTVKQNDGGYNSSRIFLTKEIQAALVNETTYETVSATFHVKSHHKMTFSYLASTDNEQSPIGSQYTPTRINAKYLKSELANVAPPISMLTGYLMVGSTPILRSKNKDSSVVYSRVLPRIPYLIGAVTSSDGNASASSATLSFQYDLSLDKSLEEFADYPVNRIRHRCAQFMNDIWTRKDCTTVRERYANIKCVCNGSTIFTVKQYVRIGTRAETLKAAVIAVPILLFISCIFLLSSALLLYIYRRKLDSKRTFVQIGVALAFLGQTLASMIYQIQYLLSPMPSVFCETIVFIYLYFRITASWWVLNEGIILLLKFRFPGYLKHKASLTKAKMATVSVCTWLIPAIVFGCIIPIEVQQRRLMELSPLYVAAEHKNRAIKEFHPNASLHQLDIYSKYIKCSPAPKSIAYKVGLATLWTTLSLNSIICMYAVWVMFRWVERHPGPQNGKANKNRIKTALIGVCTLTWCLGFPHLLVLIMRKTKMVNDVYAKFIIPKLLIFLEGPLLFYFYCWRNDKLLRTLRLSLSRLRHRRL